MPKHKKGLRIAPKGEMSFFHHQHQMQEQQKEQYQHTEQLQEQERLYVPPWTEPYIIGIAGMSGSGKTSVATRIIQEINTPWTVLLSQDNFYRPLGEEDHELAVRCEFDFDKPGALDLDTLCECVRSLRSGKKTEIPVYSFASHQRTEMTTTIYGASVIIIEGLHALYKKELRDLMDLRIFVDTDFDICLARRLARDISERGRDIVGVLRQWELHVKPSAERYIKPSMQFADIIIPQGSENPVSIEMLLKHTKRQLTLKSQKHLKHINSLTSKLKLNDSNYRNLKILEKTNQVKGIQTILLNKHTSRDDFIYYFNRMAAMLINKGLDSVLDFRSITITTPTGAKFDSVEPITNVVTVNIIRSGDCFMRSLRRAIPDISIGKLLIQSDSATGEPQLHSELLPKTISDPDTKVLLLDAQIISGATIIMAIQVLIDHGVKPSNVTVVAYLATEAGLSRILNAFKDISIVVGDIGYQKDLDNQTWFRSRFIDSVYFGTD